VTYCSDGAKWKSRRRILTPGFHFSILQDFMPLINSHAQELTDKLMRNACDVGGAYDIYDDIALSTLDIICGVFLIRSIMYYYRIHRLSSELCVLLQVEPQLSPHVVYQHWYIYEQ